jgi:hypothetical protein
MDNNYFIFTFGITKSTLEHAYSVPVLRRNHKKPIFDKGNAQGYVAGATDMPVQSFMLIIPSSV